MLRFALDSSKTPWPSASSRSGGEPNGRYRIVRSAPGRPLTCPTAVSRVLRPTTRQVLLGHGFQDAHRGAHLLQVQPSRDDRCACSRASSSGGRIPPDSTVTRSPSSTQAISSIISDFLPLPCASGARWLVTETIASSASEVRVGARLGLVPAHPLTKTTASVTGRPPGSPRRCRAWPPAPAPRRRSTAAAPGGCARRAAPPAARRPPRGDR